MYLYMYMKYYNVIYGYSYIVVSMVITFSLKKKKNGVTLY